MKFPPGLLIEASALVLDSKGPGHGGRSAGGVDLGVLTDPGKCVTLDKVVSVSAVDRIGWSGMAENKKINLAEGEVLHQLTLFGEVADGKSC